MSSTNQPPASRGAGANPIPPQRQIRALYDEETITVYQAYNESIATAAVAAQRLDASPLYMPSRATWIKPSWTWMLYRSGYSYKDANQAHILALRMTHEGFIALLRGAALAKDPHAKGEGVIVQWDPERGARLEKKEYRSLQVGIMGRTREEWIRSGIVGISDVTETARALKAVLDEDGDVTEEELREKGLLMNERVFEMPEDVRTRLGMD